MSDRGVESGACHAENSVQSPVAGGGGTDGPGDAPRAQFLQTLPPLFADDCNRIEDGAFTTNRPVAPGAEPNGANYSCKEAFEPGYYHDDTRLRDRRYLVIDRERGLVYAGVAFDHDASVRSYTVKNGRTVTVTRTAPWTWMMHEIFQHVPDPAAIRDGYREVP